MRANPELHLATPPPRLFWDRLRLGLFALLSILGLSTCLLLATGSAVAGSRDLPALAPVLEVKLKEWLAAWRTVRPGLKVEQFKRIDDRPIINSWRTVDLSRNQRDPLRIFYAFSPDQRWIVDYLRGITLDKQDSYYEVSGGPDTGVTLIDRKTSKERGLLFCGPGCGFHEAVWLSNETFIVAGNDGAGSDLTCPRGLAVVPSLFMFGPQRDSYKFYTGPKGCEGVGFEYVVRKIQTKVPNVR